MAIAASRFTDMATNADSRSPPASPVQAAVIPEEGINAMKYSPIV